MSPETSSTENPETPETPESFAEHHDGVYTSAVAAAAGLSPQQQARRRASGRVRAAGRGVVVIAGVPPTWRQAVRVAVLVAGPEVWVSHVTAERLLGAPRRPDSGIDLSGPLRRHVRLPGVRGHRTGTMEEDDLTTRSGIPCTPPLRTVIDMSGQLSDRELGVLLDHFLRRRAIRIDDLRSRVNRLRPAPGRSVARLRRVLADRIPGYDPGESELEGRIARIIDAAGLPRPEHQLRVELGARRYRVDFAWPDRRLYLEGNGFGYHSLASDLDRDAGRQNELVLDGWTPIEITWRMTDEYIVSTLRRFLALPGPFVR